jgi:DNA-directed RNA polymerase specialized sigma24 family protein
VSVSAQRPVEPLDAEAIWRDFHGRLLGFIARRVPDGDSAEDILQDVMLRVHRHAGELEHAPALSAWVHQIARTRSPTTTEGRRSVANGPQGST